MKNKVKDKMRHRFAQYGLYLSAGLALMATNLGAQTVNSNPGDNVTPNVTYRVSNTGGIGPNYYIDFNSAITELYNINDFARGADPSENNNSKTVNEAAGIKFYSGGGGHQTGGFANGAQSGSDNFIMFQDPLNNNYYYDDFNFTHTTATLDDVVDFGTDSSATAQDAYNAINGVPEASTYDLLALGVTALYFGYRRRVA